MQNASGGKTALGLENNIGALVCYAGNILCGIGGLIYSIIVITQDKENKLPRFHAFQSVILSVLCVVIAIPLWLIMFVVGFVFGNSFLFFPIAGLLGLVILGVGIAMLYFVVMSAIKAYNGEVYKIPFVGDYAEKYSN